MREAIGAICLLFGAFSLLFAGAAALDMLTGGDHVVSIYGARVDLPNDWMAINALGLVGVVGVGIAVVAEYAEDLGGTARNHPFLTALGGLALAGVLCAGAWEYPYWDAGGRLVWAVEKGDTEFFEAQLAKGPDHPTMYEAAKTAIYEDQDAMFDALIDAGMPIDPPNQDTNCLVTTSLYRPDMLRKVLALSPDITQCRNRSFASYLISNSADTLTEDEMIALIDEMARLGAPVDTETSYGHRLVDVARENGLPRVAEHMEQRKATLPQ